MNINTDVREINNIKDDVIVEVEHADL